MLRLYLYKTYCIILFLQFTEGLKTEYPGTGVVFTWMMRDKEFCNLHEEAEQHNYHFSFFCRIHFVKYWDAEEYVFALLMSKEETFLEDHEPQMS